MDIEKYLEIIVESGLRKRKSNLRFHTDTIFGGMDFDKKAVLDIGGGSGIFSFYAGAMGASRVVCLEPGKEGSALGHYEKFMELYERFGMPDVHICRESLQDYETQEKFDIIISYNSINHLDEVSCSRLLDSEHYWQNYRKIFDRIYQLAKDNASFVICDSSRYNVFPFLGLRNPFVPTINWKIHQTPGTWKRLLKEAGFTEPETVWLSHDRLGIWGTNILASFLYNSCFCIRAKKTDSQ